MQPYRPVPVAVLSALAGLGPVHAVAAQPAVPLAYPQETTTGSWMNCAPLGQSVSGHCNEARSQFVVPRAYLPSTGGQFVGLEVVPNLTQTVTYQRLDITLDHLPGAAAPRLDSTFANNLGAAATQVLSLAPNSTIAYQARTWTTIPFTTPFLYNGTDHLVIEFRKAVPPGALDTYMIVESDPRRYDLPRHLNALGPYAGGAGASNAVSATNYEHALRLRLLFRGGPSMTVLSNRGGAYNFIYALSQPVTMTAHGTPGDVFAHVVDFHGRGLSPLPIALPPLAGVSYLDFTSPYLFVIALGSIGGSGTGTGGFTVPDLPFLVGNKLAFQSVVGSPATLAFRWTPATDAIVNW